MTKYTIMILLISLFPGCNENPPSALNEKIDTVYVGGDFKNKIEINDSIEISIMLELDKRALHHDSTKNYSLTAVGEKFEGLYKRLGITIDSLDVYFPLNRDTIQYSAFLTSNGRKSICVDSFSLNKLGTKLYQVDVVSLSSSSVFHKDCGTSEPMVETTISSYSNLRFVTSKGFKFTLPNEIGTLDIYYN